MTDAANALVKLLAWLSLPGGVALAALLWEASGALAGFGGLMSGLASWGVLLTLSGVYDMLDKAMR
jgi:predicted phage tail protein